MAEGEYCKALSLLFRIAALGVSMGAAIAMAIASQVVIVDGDTKSTIYSVSYSQYNPLRYFVAAGVISAFCSAASLYVLALRADDCTAVSPRVPCLDAAVHGFLFTAAGAALATRDVVGGSVCNAAGAFCGRVTLAAALCALAAVFVAVAAALRRDAGHGCSAGQRCECC